MDSLKHEATDELQACRICLDTDTQLYNIIEYHLDSAYVEIMGTMLSAWDGLPQHVCAACRRLLRTSAEFRARGLRAQRLLQQALLQQHFITTEYIRSLDRVSAGLVLALSVARGAEPLACHHDDLVKQEPPPEPHCEDDAASDRVSPKLEEDSNDDVALSELRTPRAKDKKKKVPRKHKIKKVKSEKAERRRKTMKIRDEDFPAFEKEYNTDVIILTREQQAEDMAARKLRDNYMNSQFKCERCYKGFYTADTLRNHHLKHHDESVGAHACALCGCRFRIPAILRRHHETHRLRFVCRHCGFTARDRSHAMTHSKEHKGLRYECQYCGDSFKKRSTYGTHVRIQHPNENKSCDVCGETFLGALGLALHKKKTHRQTEPDAGAAHCASCGAVFACRYALARHAAAAAPACRGLRSGVLALRLQLQGRGGAAGAHARETQHAPDAVPGVRHVVRDGGVAGRAPRARPPAGEGAAAAAARRPQVRALRRPVHVRDVRQEVPEQHRAEVPHPLAHGREAARVPALPQALLHARRAAVPHPLAHGRQAARLPALPAALRHAQGTPDAPAEAHGRAAVQVRAVWEGLHAEDHAAETQDRAHRGEAVLVRHLRQELHAVGLRAHARQVRAQEAARAAAEQGPPRPARRGARRVAPATGSCYKTRSPAASVSMFIYLFGASTAIQMLKLHLKYTQL